MVGKARVVRSARKEGLGFRVWGTGSKSSRLGVVRHTWWGGGVGSMGAGLGTHSRGSRP